MKGGEKPLRRDILLQRLAVFIFPLKGKSYTLRELWCQGHLTIEDPVVNPCRNLRILFAASYPFVSHASEYFQRMCKDEFWRYSDVLCWYNELKEGVEPKEEEREVCFGQNPYGGGQHLSPGVGVPDGASDL